MISKMTSTVIPFLNLAFSLFFCLEVFVICGVLKDVKNNYFYASSDGFKAIYEESPNPHSKGSHGHGFGAYSCHRLSVRYAGSGEPLHPYPEFPVWKRSCSDPM
jgi:hypothetical protein